MMHTDQFMLYGIYLAVLIELYNTCKDLGVPFQEACDAFEFGLRVQLDYFGITL